MVSCYRIQFEKVFTKRINDTQIQRVLDLGCGISPYRKLFKKESYVGLDILPSVLEVSKSKGNIVVLGDMKALPFKDSIFDFVLVAFALQGVEQDDIVVQEIQRVLENNGMCVISIPTRFFFRYWWLLHHIANTRRRQTYSKHRIQKMFGHFEIIEVFPIGGLLANLCEFGFTVCKYLLNLMKSPYQTRREYSDNFLQDDEVKSPSNFSPIASLIRNIVVVIESKLYINYLFPGIYLVTIKKTL